MRTSISGALLKFHREIGRLATVTAVNVEQRFGVMRLGEDGLVTAFREKSEMDDHGVNGGFMVLEPRVFDYIKSDDTIFERESMEHLAADGQLAAYRHKGFWQCMDDQRDKITLEGLWDEGSPPWKVW